MPAHQSAADFPNYFRPMFGSGSRAPEGSSPPTRPTASPSRSPNPIRRRRTKIDERLAARKTDGLHPPRAPRGKDVAVHNGSRQSRRQIATATHFRREFCAVWATWRSGCARNFWPRRRKPRGQSCLADRQPLWTRQRRGGLGPENAPYADCPVARCFKHPVFAEPINVDCSFAAKTRVPRALRLTAGSGRSTRHFSMGCFAPQSMHANPIHAR